MGAPASTDRVRSTTEAVLVRVSVTVAVGDGQTEIHAFCVTLKAGDTLLTKPGTIHAHWNPSTSVALVFTEVVVVDQGQRSTVKMP